MLFRSLILVLSVFNGFEGLVKSLYSSFYPDIKIAAQSGKLITITPQQLKQLKGLTGVNNYSLVLEEKALVQNGDFQSVVYLKGVDENYQLVSGVADHLINGQYDIGTADMPQVILGAGVEDALGIQADRNIFTLKVYLPKKSNSNQINLLEDISVDTIRSSAAFVIQQDFDNKYGITNIDFLKRTLKIPTDQYSGVEIALQEGADEEAIKNSIKNIVGNGYKVQDKYEQNQSLYAIMNIERWVIYGVLCLILVVAAFNMIGALSMLVLEKRKDISVLHALGANKSFIQKIFLSEGMLLAFVGCVVGMLLAIFIAWLQITFHFIPLEGGSFLIDYFPVTLRLADFALVGFTVFVITFLASWIPARKAAAQEFSLRSE